MKNSWLLILPGCLFLTACGTTKEGSKGNEEKEIVSEIMWNELETAPDTMEVMRDLTKRKLFHASETIVTDLIHTKLEVRFNWNQSQLIGRETLTAKAHFYPTDSLILDAKGMEIKSVTKDHSPLNYKYDGAFLRIHLGKNYTRHENYQLVIDYVAKPEERKTSGSAAITSDKGLYFINPKGEDPNVMPQIWTQGETEASSVWFPTIDAPNIKTSQEMLITVANKYKTLSNGKFLGSKDNGDGTRTDHWKQDLPHAPYLFMMGVGAFKVVEDKYIRKNGEQMPVHYYVEPEWEEHAQAIFGETPAMIAFFSELTGVPFAWDKYHQIVVRDYVSGAMENTGAVIFGDYAYKTKRELLDENDQSTIAHELFHHWFGDLVTCESWSNLPLNESFANYSQYLWDEHRYGLDQADYYAESEKDGYFASFGSGNSHDLIWYDYDDKEQMFDAHSYNKGGRILHMLRSYLGDSAFFGGLKLYLQRNQFKAAEFHQLRLAFEEVCGEDLNWFFDQWFQGSGHPILDVEQYFSKENKEVTITVFQNQELGTTPLYKLPVQIMVYDDAGEHLHRVTIEKLESKFTFPISGVLHNVIFDYQQSLLGEIKVYKPKEQYIHQYEHGKRYLARRDALIHGAELRDSSSAEMILKALNDPFWDIRLQAMERASYLNETDRERASDIVRKLVDRDPSPHVRATGLSFLSSLLLKSDMIRLCRERIEKDSSYQVIGTALSELNKIDIREASSLAQSLEKEPASKMKAAIAQIYAKNAQESKLSFFEHLLDQGSVKGYDAIICLNSFTVFMSQQRTEIQEKALPIYQNYREKGGLYTRMFMPQNIAYFVSILEQKKKELGDEISSLDNAGKTVEATQKRNEEMKLDKLIGEFQNYAEKIASDKRF
ncbi:MAG: hypothetical protein EP338_00430 [Bacteroidetes bacterium]|nr:MAG: hypothetical protein EP338_00430 [Bacteroidota bacterium]